MVLSWYSWRAVSTQSDATNERKSCQRRCTPYRSHVSPRFWPSPLLEKQNQVSNNVFVIVPSSMLAVGQQCITSLWMQTVLSLLTMRGCDRAWSELFLMTLFQNVVLPDDDGEANKKKMVPGTTTIAELCCFLVIYLFFTFFFPFNGVCWMSL